MSRLSSLLASLLVLSLSVTVAAVGAQAGDGSTGTASANASATTPAAGSTDSEGKRPRNPLIKADIQALKAARKQLKDDRENKDVDRLTADRNAVKAAFKKLREDIATLRKDHKTDA